MLSVFIFKGVDPYISGSNSIEGKVVTSSSDDTHEAADSSVSTSAILASSAAQAASSNLAAASSNIYATSSGGYGSSGSASSYGGSGGGYSGAGSYNAGGGSSYGSGASSYGGGGSGYSGAGSYNAGGASSYGGSGASGYSGGSGIGSYGGGGGFGGGYGGGAGAYGGAGDSAYAVVPSNTNTKGNTLHLLSSLAPSLLLSSLLLPLAIAVLSNASGLVGTGRKKRDTYGIDDDEQDDEADLQFTLDFDNLDTDLATGDAFFSPAVDAFIKSYEAVNKDEKRFIASIRHHGFLNSENTCLEKMACLSASDKTFKQKDTLKK